VGGVPSTGVSAVVVNVTVTEPTSNGYLTAFPANLSPPLASNVNFGARQTVANRAIVPVPTSGPSAGHISLFNSAGRTHVVVDVGGWYTTTGTAGGATTSMTPVRVLDTRGGSAVSREARPLKVAGAGGVATQATAAVLNVTVTNPSTSSWLTVWPTGAAQPFASDLNFVAGQTVPNLVIAKLGTEGSINMATGGGGTDVVVDVVGFVT
jgi:hypothetical protein